MDTLLNLVNAYLTPANGAILIATWTLVEVTQPLVTLVVMSKALVRYRQPLHRAASVGKKLAAAIWCSALMWVPTFQPPLCEGPADGVCQPLVERLAAGLLLGLLLSLGHASFMAIIRKRTGRIRLVTVRCVNCRKTYRASSLEDACAHCGNPPDEVVR